MLIRNAHLIVGDGDEIAAADVLVKAGRIVQISSDRITVDEPQVIDATGKSLLPGLIDAHLHFDFLSVGNAITGYLHKRRHLATLAELLQSGVTSVRTMADPLAEIRWLRKRVLTGRAAGPNLVIAGPAVTATGGHPAVTVCRDNPWLRQRMVRSAETGDQAREVVRSLHAAGVNLIKIVFQGGRYAEFGDRLRKLSVDAVAEAIHAAHQLGLPVSAHTHYQADVEQLIELGIDSIEHGVIEDRITDDGFLKRWADSGVPLVSTLTIEELVRDGSGHTYLATAGANLRRAHEAGVRIVAGTDSMVGAMSADSLHQELRLMVEAGLPPAAVIQSATHNAADLLGLADRGRIEEGAVADLLLLNANPMDDIGATTDLALVIKDGRIAYEPDRPTTIELMNFVAPDQPVERFSDSTAGVFDDTVLVELDSGTFAGNGLRTITYTDPTTGQVLRTETLRSEPTLLTREWTCVVPSEEIDISAHRRGDRIELSGTFKGKQVSRSYGLHGGPWLQGLPFDVATFIVADGDTLEFQAIGTTGRGALEISGFELTKDPKATGTEVSTSLVMPRWRRFWGATARYDAATGQLISYMIKNKPSAVIERR